MRRSVPVTASWDTRLLAVLTAVLVVFGLAAVYSSSSIVAVQGDHTGSYYALRQLVGATIGTALMIVGARIAYQRWAEWAWWGLAVAAVLLLILLIPLFDFIVLEINGARRWLGRPGLSFQPAEFAKFAVVAWVAMLAAKKGEGVRRFKRGIVPFLVILGPFAALILFEPALSTAALTVLIAGTVLFAAGARIGHFLILAIAALPIVWREVAATQYRLQRWITFLSPGTDYTESSWQIQQSLIGMGSGRFFGVGFGEGMQKLGYLPESFSDFVFSTIGEEWGFVGVVVLVLLFAAYVGLGLRIARTAPTPFGTLLATGLTVMIGLTAFLHIAVTLAVVPTTGLPLPFVSYGRSNLVVSMLAAGVLINIGESRTVEPGRR